MKGHNSNSERTNADICCFELFPFNYAQNDIFISFLTQRIFFLKFLPLIEFTAKTYKILFPPLSNYIAPRGIEMGPRASSA
jgi:hypothetical protein